jgi:hypothetical protein
LIGVEPINWEHSLLGKQRLKTVAPSQEDKEAFLKTRRGWIQGCKEDLSKYEELPDAHKSRKLIPVTKQRLQNSENLVKKAERMDCEAGYVFAGSGFRTTVWQNKLWILDWAVVFLHESRSMENTWTSRFDDEPVWPLDEVSVDAPDDDDSVVKVGRSDHNAGKYLEGRVNAINGESPLSHEVDC